jgi:outer membrane protein assembly factor BamB
MFHGDPSHTGLSLDSLIGSSNAPQLTPSWQANIGVSYVSPAVVYRPSLGRTLVYVGSNNGTFAAYDAVTGARVWFYRAGAAIQSSPAVVNGVVYFGSNDHRLYALNADTGVLLCRFDAGAVIYSSPVIADPDGAGSVVYFGDSGLNGSDDGGHFWAINAVDPNPASDCGLRWTYGAFGDPPGSQPAVGAWSPPAFSVDVNGRPLVVFGGGSPEGAVYALDARDGSRIWRFKTETFATDHDVGAGPTISPPGVNGFADGVVYVAGKDAILYALNLRTGARIWEFRIRDDGGAFGATRSTAALVGSTLYLGNGPNVTMYAVNAVTGQKVWSSSASGGAGVLASPVVTGAPGDRVLFVGDTSGKIWAHDLATGQVRWSYNTGTLIYSSLVVVGDRLFATNSGGFLYAFSFGGGLSAPPDTTIVSPAKGSTVPNPGGNQALSGNASDDVGVAQVLVTVQDKNRGLYWDGASVSWRNVVTQNAAALVSPGSASTGWSYAFPAPSNGGPFIIQAEAVDADGQHDPSIAQSNFVIASLTSPPDTTISSPANNQLFVFPAGRQSFDITISGTAVDPGGVTPGVQTVWVVVTNIEHTEYFCGPPGCGGGTARWRPTWSQVAATLSSPGATSTGWSLTFPTYDHPHTYKIVAWAVDRNGNTDPTRAMVMRMCVKDPGTGGCP